MLDEHRPLFFQILHHETVMYHLVAHINRRPMHSQRPFDDFDRAVDAGAKTAGVRK